MSTQTKKQELTPTSEQIAETLLAVSERLQTQDNRVTDNPMFCVREKIRTYGFDPRWSDQTVCVETDCYEEVPKGTKGAIEVSYKDHWQIVMVAFTEAGCKQYIELNGHNHRGKLEIYVESFNRCPEMIAIRKSLLGYEATATTQRKLDEATDKEQARWQEAIYGLVCKACPDANIDGAGSDTGDPLDFTLAEIGQGLAHIQNKLDEAALEIKCLKSIEGAYMEAHEELSKAGIGDTGNGVAGRIKHLCVKLDEAERREKELRQTCFNAGHGEELTKNNCGCPICVLLRKQKGQI